MSKSLLLVSLFCFSATASAQYDTRFALSLEGGGGILTDSEEADEATILIPGGLGSLMLGARVGQIRPYGTGDMSWTIAYQGSVFADDSAILHRHQPTVSLHLAQTRGMGYTFVVGGGLSVLTPFGDAADGESSVLGGSITIDTRFMFGRSGVFLAIPFKVDFFPEADFSVMQMALSLGFQTF